MSYCQQDILAHKAVLENLAALVKHGESSHQELDFRRQAMLMTTAGLQTALY